MTRIEERIQERKEILTEEDQQIRKRIYNKIAILEVPEPKFEQEYFTLRNEKGKVEEHVSLYLWDSYEINWDHILKAVKYYTSINKKVALKRLLSKLNKEFIHMEASKLEEKIQTLLQQSEVQKEQKIVEVIGNQKREPIKETSIIEKKPINMNGKSILNLKIPLQEKKNLKMEKKRFLLYLPLSLSFDPKKD